MKVKENAITCRKPIPKANLAEYGCDNGQCDIDFIAKGPNKANWLWPNGNYWIPPVFDGQQHCRDSFQCPYLDFHRQFNDANLMKCYPKIDDGCDPADLGFNQNVETADDVSWNCPNSHGLGAVCEKSCKNGKWLNGRKSERTCECKSRCQWKGAVASCTR